jgi:hypothetical protein
VTIKELEKQLENENLLIIYDRGVEKKYINGEDYTNRRLFPLENRFGIYEREDGKYVVFFTEDDRGGLEYYNNACDTESEACDSLYKKITRLDRIYKKDGANFLK